MSAMSRLKAKRKADVSEQHKQQSTARNEVMEQRVGPMLVIAGGATGKSTTLMRRLAELGLEIDLQVIDRATLRYAQVLGHTVDTFGSRSRAMTWLNRPSRTFNNQSPLQVLTQDPAAVEEELVRIDHGMFA